MTDFREAGHHSRRDVAIAAPTAASAKPGIADRAWRLGMHAKPELSQQPAKDTALNRHSTNDAVDEPDRRRFDEFASSSA